MKPVIDIKPTLNPGDWLNDHGDYLFRYAGLRVRDGAIAEDLLQETLLAAMSGYQRHEGRGSERTWLVGIMRHKILDYFRKLARTPEFQICNYENDDESNWFETEGAWRGHWREDQAPLNWPLDAATLLESSEFWATFERCLSRLSPQMATAFTLREIEGMSSEEICEILNVTPNNLWVILHRSRARLRQLLEREWFRNFKPTAPVESVKRRSTELPQVQLEFTHRAVAA